MNANLSQMQQTRAAAWLIEQKLAEPCKECPEVQKLLRDLNGRSKHITLTADYAYPEGVESKFEDIGLGGKLHFECGACKGTGIVPTKIGWQLVGFVKQFMDKASGTNLDEIYEVPF